MKAAPRRSLRQSLIAALVLRCNKIAHVEMVYEHQRRALRTTEGANESELIRYVAAYARRGAARRGAVHFVLQLPLAPQIRSAFVSVRAWASLRLEVTEAFSTRF
jgi:hypothetical protein